MKIFRDKSGASGVEFAMTVPILLLLFLGAVTVFDLYRSYSLLVQANYIVSDMVTRETTIDKAYVDRVYGVYTNLFGDTTSAKALRISSIVKAKGVLKVAWTTQRGDVKLIPVQVIDAAELPDIPDTDSIIYVEGYTKHNSVTTFLGFGSKDYADHTYARPRFISAIALVN